jgi:hypothetical protein
VKIPGTKEVTFRPTDCEIGTDLKAQAGYTVLRPVECPHGGAACLSRQLKIGALTVPGTTRLEQCANYEITGHHQVADRAEPLTPADLELSQFSPEVPADPDIQV